MTPDPGQWHRLHPLSPLVRSGRAAIGVLAIVGISASGQFGRDGSHLYDWAVAVLVVIAAVVSWLVTRWKLDGSTLRIETGLLRRDSRQLPVARIQAVDVVRPFLARALGLAELRVRLAGSSHADGRSPTCRSRPHSTCGRGSSPRITGSTRPPRNPASGSWPPSPPAAWSGRCWPPGPACLSRC